MEAEVVVIGGGPAGSAAALELAQSGVDTLVIEKTDFPRFHVGESLTGAAGKMLRKLGLEDEMTEARYPVKHGTRVFGAGGKNDFYVPVVDVLDDGTRDLAATTWQVRRSTFDEMLLTAASRAGARVVSAHAESPSLDGDVVRGVKIVGDDGPETVDAGAVIDATGQSCFLAKHGVTAPKTRGDYDKQIAVFTHLAGADRGTGDTPDDTVILYSGPGHWAWFIPIDDEIVSVGVVVASSYYRDLGLEPAAFLEHEFQTLNPELSWRVEGAEMAIEPQLISNYSYGIDRFVGPGWMCAGDSHQFVDPVFSFGVHFALHEGVGAAGAARSYVADPNRDMAPLDHYQSWAEDGQGVVRDLLDGFWGRPLAFGYLVHSRYHDDLVDLFAGRVYGIVEPTKGLNALRDLTAQVREERAAQPASSDNLLAESR